MRTKPGKQAEFEGFAKRLVPPAMKNAGVKDYRVPRVVLGRAIGEHTVLPVFDKWAEMDALLAQEKLFGAQDQAYLAQVAECVDHAEATVARMIPELGYRAQ